VKRLALILLLCTASASAQVVWSISRTGSSQTPTPFPLADRICCGGQSNWTGVETARGTWVFTLVDNFITNVAGHPGTFLIWTDRAVPAWASGGATTIAPSDLAVSALCQAPLAGVTTTDCQYKEYVTKFMQHVCHVASQPGTPLVGACDIKVYEVWNEMNVGGYWTDTVAKLAQMAEDKTVIIRLYCGDCTVLGGSVSAGGDGTGGSWINGSVGLEPFLAAWGALPGAHHPDAVSWHAYPSRTTIKPVPFPETLTAHGSATCTGSSNTSCRTAIKDQIATLYSSSIMCNASITAWACSLPIWQTEGLYGLNSSLTDGVSDTSANTWLLRRAYTSRWMIAQSAKPASGSPPVQSMFYSWQDQCWGTANGTNVADGNCQPPNSLIPVGVTDNQVSFLQTKTWLDNTKYVGPLSSAAVGGGNVWTVPIIYKGYPAQLAWYDGWLATTSFSTPFSKALTIKNVSSAVVSTVTIGNEPVLLTRPNSITFSDF
jgi:hypothetical protein